MNGSSAAATSNGGTIAEKLGLGPTIRELKFGPGFLNSGASNRGHGRGVPSSPAAKAAAAVGNFHTIRYDFKPASVDASQPSSVDVDSNKQITISIPHSDGAGANVFKGPMKPYTKECVLIIDHETGEVTLEKLSTNIQVKKTRQEGGSRAHKPPSAPVPAPPPPVPSEKKKHQPPPPPPPTSSKHEKDIFSKKSKSSSKNTSSSASSLLPANRGNHPLRPNSPMLNVPARHSPLGFSPAPAQPQSPEAIKATQSMNSSNLPSLSSIEDLILSEPTPSTTTVTNGPVSSLNTTSVELHPKPRGIIASKNINEDGSSRKGGDGGHHSKVSPSKPKHSNKKGELSESSSSGSESGSSSSSSSESESESSDEEMVDVDDIPIAPMKHLPMMPMLPSHKPKPVTPAPSMPSFGSSPESSMKKPPPQSSSSNNKSMPTHLLSRDLRLTDTSDSDSD